MNLGIVKHKNMIKYTIINKWEALIEKLNDYIHFNNKQSILCCYQKRIINLAISIHARRRQSYQCNHK